MLEGRQEGGALFDTRYGIFHVQLTRTGATTQLQENVRSERILHFPMITGA